MLFIGGISQGRKLLNYARSILCGSCGSTSQCQVFMTYLYFSFFFIPLFKWNKRFYVQMSCCSAYTFCGDFRNLPARCGCIFLPGPGEGRRM